MRRARRDRHASLVAQTTVADGVVVLTLARPDGRPAAGLGRRARTSTSCSPTATTRQYSLCGDRWDAHRYRVAVLREPDGPRRVGLRARRSCAVGDLVGLGGPRNNFPLVPVAALPVRRRRHRHHPAAADDRPGRAGRRGLAAALRRPHAARRWRSSTSSAGHGDRVARRARRTSAGCSPWPPGSPHRGTDTVVYCCGPAAAAGRRRAAAVRRRWPPHRCAPSGSPPRSRARRCGTTPFDVELARTGATVDRHRRSSRCSRPSRARRRRPRCRRAEQGTCGTCETTVLDGVPDHRDSILADDERAAGDCMFLCVSRSGHRPSRARPVRSPR